MSATLIETLERKWTMPILLKLGEVGTMRFGALRDALDISPKMLTKRLRALEREGLVDRQFWPTIPPQVDYSLTAEGERVRARLLPLEEEPTAATAPSGAKKIDTFPRSC